MASPRLHSPTLSASSSSSSTGSCSGDNSNSNATGSSNSKGKGKERAAVTMNDSETLRHHRQHSTSSACPCCHSEQATLLARGGSHPPRPLKIPSIASTSTSPWSIDSLIHLTRRAARQLTFTSSSHTSSGGVTDGYLPLYSPANTASTKQRLSSEVYLGGSEKQHEDGNSD